MKLMKYEKKAGMPAVAPYGSWKSPITTEVVTSSVVGLSEIQLDGQDIYWLESRPSELGRTVIVKSTDGGGAADFIPPPYNARTRVHEYGGASYLVVDGTVFFSNFADNGLYRTDPENAPTLLAPLSGRRFADFIFDRPNNRLISVCEDHSAGGHEPVNTLVGIDLLSGEVTTLVSGADFYSSPRLSPTDNRLSWLSWNHPNMPWNGTELWTADVQPGGDLNSVRLAAGGARESIFQPTWSPVGELFYVSDRSGWWNIYRHGDATGDPLWSKNAEFGLPQWVFGQSTYAFGTPDSIVCTYTSGGVWYLASIETITSRITEIDTRYTVISYVVAKDNLCCFIGASPDTQPAIVSVDLAIGKYTVLKASSSTVVPEPYLSIAESIEFSTADGLTAYANYYPPRNDNYYPPDELPPLVVACHGGPTSATYSQLNLGIQYWTSRGFAYVSVNYGGSTGYGKDYQERLENSWGNVDVTDSINCALYLAEVGKADIERLTIHGGSAGGFTALCALTFHSVFAAGASLYGVSDLEALAKDTHKFESRYLDRLVGPYPERLDLYIERSPIHFAQKLSSPVIFFQGLDDKVVPPDQATKMVDALVAQGIPVAYVPFAGEGHGFRKGDSIQRYLDAHLTFYAKIFGITLHEPIKDLEIIGLDR